MPFSVLKLVWPGRLRTPAIDLEARFDDVVEALERVPDGEVTRSLDDERRKAELSCRAYRCWVEEDPNTGLVHSCGYDDPAGRLWERGRARKLLAYLKRQSQNVQWDLIVEQTGYHFMWRNGATGHRAVYGLHADVVLFYADRDDDEQPAEPETGEAPKGPTSPAHATDGGFSAEFLDEVFPNPTGATEAELSRLERRVGKPLPQAYRQLLAHNNGGWKEFDCYEHDGRTIYLQALFSISDPDDGMEEGIEWELTACKAPIGRHKLIPIAFCGDSDYLFLSLRDGAVHYRARPRAKFERVADSLPDFFARLKDGFS
jgi:hypothetical protein